MALGQRWLAVYATLMSLGRQDIPRLLRPVSPRWQWALEKHRSWGAEPGHCGCQGGFYCEA